MRAHWFTVLNAAGIILLAGQFLGGGLLGGELQWKKPVNDEAAVIRFPAVISTDEAVSPVQQVQAVQPIQPLVRPIPPSASQLDMQYPELRPQNLPVPPGATTNPNDSPVPPQSIPIRTGEVTRVPCADQVPLKAIRDISHSIKPTIAGAQPVECAMNHTPFDGRHFSQSCVQWKASAVCTKGAYFEDVQLERYGHTVTEPMLQPIVSGAKFFATIPFLPYKMGVTPPNECVYSLGYYRSGSRSPYMRQPIPISARGMLFEAAAIGGAAAIIP